MSNGKHDGFDSGGRSAMLERHGRNSPAVGVQIHGAHSSGGQSASAATGRDKSAAEVLEGEIHDLKDQANELIQRLQNLTQKLACGRPIATDPANPKPGRSGLIGRMSDQVGELGSLLTFAGSLLSDIEGEV